MLVKPLLAFIIAKLHIFLVQMKKQFLLDMKENYPFGQMVEQGVEVEEV